MNTDFFEIFDDSVRNLSQVRCLLELFKILADNGNEGLVLMDEKGYIQYTNKKHAEYLGLPREKLLYSHITEATDREHAEDFLRILRTGQAEMNKVVKAHGKEYVANQVPLFKEGKLIGAAGVILFDISEIDVINQRVIRLENQVRHYQDRIKQLSQGHYSLKDILGESRPIQEVKQEALQAAKGDANVLLIGESGTGKELFAHAIHNQSRRRHGPFVRVNCSAIPRELLESELFGYEPGSFTGALKKLKKGKFELADNGTIFLDEIGDMPLQMQSELLRVLQEKEVDRIGGSGSIKVDFRVIAATNKDLEVMVHEGSFRKDLFYRVNVLRIALPPLHRLREDIPLMAKHFLERKSTEIGLEDTEFSPGALSMLKDYEFPGNVRELQNIVERALSHVDLDTFTGRINEEDIASILGLHGIEEHRDVARTDDLKSLKRDQEVRAIINALRLGKGNLKKCADLLGIHRTGLYKKIRALNLHQEVALARKRKLDDDVDA
jgi:PAS domain S-box-containing protein